MQLFAYSALHFMEDTLCAYWVLSRFCGDRVSLHLLLYNFCAFALQLPFGILLDSFQNRTRSPMPSFLTAIAGLLLTVLGFLSPVLCGIGNALFHVGGGVAVIREDNGKHLKGAALGCFVAPGAVGLYRGVRLASLPPASVAVPWLVLSALFCLFLFRAIRQGRADLPPLNPEREERTTPELCAILACFVVVVLRSYAGSVMAFPWKEKALAAIAIFAVAGGKLFGGLLAKRFGALPVTVASLLPAAALFCLSNTPVFGIPALLFFNMTMPLTLQAPACRLPRHGGFCFGLLTFGLFLGWLPTGLKLALPESRPVTGALLSLLSLALLLPALLQLRRNAE